MPDYDPRLLAQALRSMPMKDVESSYNAEGFPLGQAFASRYSVGGGDPLYNRRIDGGSLSYDAPLTDEYEGRLSLRGQRDRTGGLATPNGEYSSLAPSLSVGNGISAVNLGKTFGRYIDPETRERTAKPFFGTQRNIAIGDDGLLTYSTNMSPGQKPTHSFDYDRPLGDGKLSAGLDTDGTKKGLAAFLRFNTPF